MGVQRPGLAGQRVHVLQGATPGRQVEASRTLVFDDPRRARGFFESLVADNIGIGRPHEVAAVFARRVTKRTPGIFRTRVFGPGTEGRDYSRSQMTYDLRRLRLHGLIQRIPRTNTYVLTPDGARVALLSTKVHGRLVRPLVAAADQPPAPIELRRALATIDKTIAHSAQHARLNSAA